jgi:DDT domain
MPALNLLHISYLTGPPCVGLLPARVHGRLVSRLADPKAASSCARPFLRVCRYGSGADGGQAVSVATVQRPPFPPPAVRLQAAFPQELGHEVSRLFICVIRHSSAVTIKERCAAMKTRSTGGALASFSFIKLWQQGDGVLQAARELVAAWGFLHTFGEVLGVWPASLTELLAALVDGACSRLTAEMHIGLLRLLQVCETHVLQGHVSCMLHLRLEHQLGM